MTTPARDAAHDALDARRIAVVGMACRLPGASTPAELWALLSEGRSAVRDVPTDRVALVEAYDADPAKVAKTNLRRGAFFDRIPEFDHAFFQISAREQERMDPQQKMMLEVVWEALEDAGEPADRLAGARVGVFVGAMSSEHAHSFVLDPATVDIFSGTSGGLSMIANRVSFVFDFVGPSLAVETACSSSLLAIHLAAHSLRRGECDVAIVGGTNLVLSPAMSIFYTKAGIASPDGDCRTFDAAANGITRGEGAATVVLKREDDARRAGNPIHAFVRGSAVNQDGRSNGMTAPNGIAQQALLREALDAADVRPQDVWFVEAHGTATQLGDTIEALALGEVLGKSRPAGAPPLATGSIKSNFGHLEGAAGIAGVLKAVLALSHRALPPTLHFTKPNPRVPFDEIRVRPQVVLGPCVGDDGNKPLFAGVSSFSLGGSNAHVVLESGPRGAATDTPVVGEGDVLPFVLSAKTARALEQVARRLRTYIAAGKAPALAPLAATLLHGRSALPIRAFVLARTHEELLARLDRLGRGERGDAGEGIVGPIDVAEQRALRRRRAEAPVATATTGPFDVAVAAWRWAHGEPDGWGPFEALRAAPKLRLPTYPFDRGRAAASSDHFHVVRFRRCAPAAVPWPMAGCLVFGDDHGVADALAGALRDRGCKVALIHRTASGQPLGELDIVATPTSRDDVLGVLDELAARGFAADTIVHLGPCLPSGEAALSPERFEPLMARTAHAILGLAQALQAKGSDARVLVVGCNGASGEDSSSAAPHPAAAAAFAIARVAGREDGRGRFAVLDVDDGADERKVAGRVLDELEWGSVFVSAARSIVAYRRGQRLEPRFEPYGQDAAPDTHALRPGGVYLITGGFGGLGRVVAEHLARTYEARLVLVGRPPRDDTARAERESFARAIASFGGEAIAVFADVTDATAMREAVTGAIARWGTLHGVIHAAGVLDDSLIGDIDGRRLDAALRPKALGALVLECATREIPLDFFAVFSSVAAPFAPPGQASHAAANAFEDAWVAASARPGAKSIQWGFWGQSGVVARPEYRRRLEQRGIVSIEDAEGIDALERSLGQGPRVLAYFKARDPATIASLSAMPSGRPTAPDLDVTAQGLMDRYALGSYGPVVDALDALSLHYVAEAFTHLPGERERAAVARAVVPPYEKFVTAFFARHPDLFARPGRDGAQPAEGRADRLCREHPSAANEIRLVERAGRALPDVLTGKTTALEVLFSGGSMELLFAVYERSALARAANDLTRSALAACLAGLSGAPRILELGAGTGATTKSVVDLAERGGATYTFSDIAPMFVKQAEKTFRGRSGMTFKVLDIEDDGAVEQVAREPFDVVVAANCFHATRDLRATARNARRLLAPGGTLLVIETVRRRAWLDLVFGLTEGWWRHDDDVRSDGPHIDGPRWEALLAEAGFVSTQATSLRLGPTAPPEVAVIVAARGTAPASPRATHAPTHSPPEARKAPVAAAPSALAESRAVDALRAGIAASLQIERGAVPLDETFDTLGLDSLHAVEISSDLSTTLGVRISATAFFEHPTVRKLGGHIASALNEVSHAPAPAAAPGPHPMGDGTQGAAVAGAIGEAQADARAAAPPPGRGSDRDEAESVAVIGFACRFPGAPDAPAFWQLLASGGDAVAEVPPERWSSRDLEKRGGGSKWGAFLTNVEEFDPLFFRMTPRDAKLVDPQQRIFLEVAWHALEHAGYAGDGARPRDVGVFAGCTQVGFAEVLGRAATPEQNVYAGVGNPNAFVPNRVSFFCNFRGPSVLVDTMCSSSLVAVHQARLALARGECELAIAGGVNVLLSPGYYASLARIGAHSPTGRCRPFDHRADGFVSAEGAGAVLLKPLANALRDGDTIHAVIRGSAVNHNGATNGFTAPNSDAQADVIGRALASAKLSAREISYVEAHGTGTSLGDPIEVEALTRAFRNHTDRRQFCLLGSVKSNIGHAEAAAGMAGLIKVILALRHRVLPGTLHFEKPNAHIDFAKTPFVVAPHPMAWNADGPLRAGVSAFGLGGANAHIVVEEPPKAADANARAGTREVTPALFTVSADSADALRQVIAMHAAHIRATSGLELQDVCHTSRVGRAHRVYRAAIVCDSTLDLLHKLEELSGARDDADLRARGCFRGTAREMSPGERARVPASPEAVAAAYADGVVGAVELAALSLTGARRVPLPLHRFRRVRCWPEAPNGAASAADASCDARSRAHPLLGKRVEP